MEEVVQFIIAVIFIGVALVFKLKEMTSRKKMPLPLPEIEPTGEVIEEVEIIHEPKVEIRPVFPRPKPIIKVKVPEAATWMLSTNELQRGIILSAILGPPRGLSRWGKGPIFSTPR